MDFLVENLWVYRGRNLISTVQDVKILEDVEVVF
jgi:hypothetical protein